MKTVACLQTLLFLVFFCGPAAAVVNPPVLISQDSVLAATTGRPVLIYYANETAPTPEEKRNYDVLTSWLLESGTTEARKTADRWAADLKKFPVIVDRELEAIRALASSKGASAVIATNRSVRSGYIEVHSPVSGWKRIAFDAPANGNYIKDSNPLAAQTTLGRLLSAAAKEFPASRHTYLLHVKSHGAKTHVVSTNIAKRHEDLVKAELISSLKKTEQAIRTTGQVQEVEAGKVGITKDEFFAVLKSAGNSGMKFPLVFLETCRSGISMSGAANGTANIGFLVSSDQKGIGYENIDFARIQQQDNHSLFQSYYSQLAASASESHKMDYGIELGLSPSFLPSRTARFSYLVRNLLPAKN